MGPLAWRGQWCIWNPCSRTLRVRDKAVILPATLRAPSRCFIKPRGALGAKRYFIEPWVASGAKRNFVKLCAASGLSGTSNQLVPGSAHTFSATPRRSRRPPRAQAKPLVCRQTLPASAEREAASMTALSRTRSVREHGFQMHHDPLQARGPT